MKRVLGVIPARYGSSRFEGKPLIKISGIEMIKRTYNQCLKSKLLSKVIIATDSKKIYDFCKEEQLNVIMTSDKCLTGTDRVAEVSQKMPNYDLYLNIQGDEPVIDPESFSDIINSYEKYGEKYIAYNGYKKIRDSEEIISNTIIKVIFNKNEELMYMSRLPIPYNKSMEKREYFKQVCVYGFTKEALNIFSNSEKTLNEKYEDIEILRYIDLGHKVKMVRTEYDSIAVDTPEDVLKVEKFLNRKNEEM